MSFALSNGQNDRKVLGYLYKNAQMCFVYCCGHCDLEFRSGVELETHTFAHDVKVEAWPTKDATSYGDPTESEFMPLLDVSAIKTEPIVQIFVDHDVDITSKLEVVPDSTLINKVLQMDADVTSDDTDKRQFKCAYCSEIFDRKYNLQTHMRTHTKEKCHKCEFCPKIFNSLVFKRVHERRKHIAEKRFFCAKCPESFFTLDTLQQHSEQQHIELHKMEVDDTISSVKPLYQCKHCPKRFSSKCDLILHERMHNSGRPYKCATCSADFSQYSTLVQHTQRHPNKATNTCNFCSSVFLTEQALERHMQERMRFTCELCRTNFAKQSSLIAHMRVHTDGRSHKCVYCPSSFYNQTDLTIHERKHTGDRMYKCEICSALFMSHGHLVDHMQKHSSHPCQFCKCNFISKATLRIHKEKCAREKPTVTCPQCKELFPSRISLRIHIENGHFEGENELFPEQDQKNDDKRL